MLCLHLLFVKTQHALVQAQRSISMCVVSVAPVHRPPHPQAMPSLTHCNCNVCGLAIAVTVSTHCQHPMYPFTGPPRTSQTVNSPVQTLQTHLCRPASPKQQRLLCLHPRLSIKEQTQHASVQEWHSISMCVVSVAPSYVTMHHTPPRHAEPHDLTNPCDQSRCLQSEASHTANRNACEPVSPTHQRLLCLRPLLWTEGRHTNMQERHSCALRVVSVPPVYITMHHTAPSHAKP